MLYWAPRSPDRCDDCWNPSGGVLGDVGDPQLIRAVAAEVAFDQVGDRDRGRYALGPAAQR
jgi:hypothetical protein